MSELLANGSTPRAPRPRGRTSAAALARARALAAVPSTLRIPLAARAHGDRLFPHVAVHDAHARAALDAIGDDGERWINDRPSVYGVLARTRLFRTFAHDFVAAHPGGHVANLGCGLSHYLQWLDDGRMRMTDADLPDVLALRRLLLPPPPPRHEMRELDLASPGWWDAVGLAARRDDAPVHAFSEGVLMYLPPERVDAVFATFAERAPPGSTFAFDALCWLAVGHAQWHPSVCHTDAEFSWGLRRAGDVAQAHPRLRLVREHAILSGYGLPYSIAEPAFHALTGTSLYGVYLFRAE